MKDCVALLTAGTAIQYKGQAGVGPFNAKNDPSSACPGVYGYQDDNSYTFMKSVFGESWQMPITGADQDWRGPAGV